MTDPTHRPVERLRKVLAGQPVLLMASEAEIFRRGGWRVGGGPHQRPLALVNSVTRSARTGFF